MKIKICKHKNKWIWGKTIYLIVNSGIGIVSLSLDNNYPGICFLSGLSVVEDHRKKGYGNRLLGLAEQEAKDNGCTEIILSCEKNTFVPEWYKRHGYELLEGKKIQDTEYYTLTKKL